MAARNCHFAYDARTRVNKEPVRNRPALHRLARICGCRGACRRFFLTGHIARGKGIDDHLAARGPLTIVLRGDRTFRFRPGLGKMEEGTCLAARKPEPSNTNGGTEFCRYWQTPMAAFYGTRRMGRRARLQRIPDAGRSFLKPAPWGQSFPKGEWTDQRKTAWPANGLYSVQGILVLSWFVGSPASSRKPPARDQPFFTQWTS